MLPAMASAPDCCMTTRRVSLRRQQFLVVVRQCVRQPLTPSAASLTQSLREQQGELFETSALLYPFSDHSHRPGQTFVGMQHVENDPEISRPSLLPIYAVGENSTVQQLCAHTISPSHNPQQHLTPSASNPEARQVQLHNRSTEGE